MANYCYDAWGRITEITGDRTIADINPIRYRSYYYDKEIELYYLNSRYYSPDTFRFINADEYVQTGQGMLDKNMFAYCANNPVSRIDSTGQFWGEIWEFVKTAVAEIGRVLGILSPAYAGCGGAAVADGPLPIGDTVGLVAAAALTAGAIGYGVYKTAKTSLSVRSIPKIKAKAKAKAKAIPNKPDNHVIFPVNPNDFKPNGLVMIPRTGTKNGALISWVDPITNTEVFRWDENTNYQNGSHYHIYGSGHYIPGVDTVPEPYESIYF